MTLEGVHNSKSRRIYFVEFLRIYLILSVFLFHVGNRDIKLRENVQALLHTNAWRPDIAVEAFFIIGGFFLYRRITRNDETLPFVVYTPPPQRSMLAHVGKLWMRLMPGIIFCYLLLALVGVRYWRDFPFLFFPAGQGIGFHHSLIGYGDWFVEVYFVVDLFLISLFNISRKSAWFWMCALTILCWCIQMNNQPGKGLALGGMYYGALAVGIVRGLSCMALGMVASCLSSVWDFEKRLPLRAIATVYEAVALLVLFNYMYRTTHAPYSPIAIELVVAMLLISAANGWGYLSNFLNRFSGVMRISRYTYSLLLSQATICAYFVFHHKFNLPYPALSLAMIGATIPLTLIEYHFVERWLVPKLKLCFQNAP